MSIAFFVEYPRVEQTRFGFLICAPAADAAWRAAVGVAAVHCEFRVDVDGNVIEHSGVVWPSAWPTLFERTDQIGFRDPWFRLTSFGRRAVRRAVERHAQKGAEMTRLSAFLIALFACFTVGCGGSGVAGTQPVAEPNACRVAVHTLMYCLMGGQDLRNGESDAIFERHHFDWCASRGRDVFRNADGVNAGRVDDYEEIAGRVLDRCASARVVKPYACSPETQAKCGECAGDVLDRPSEATEQPLIIALLNCPYDVTVDGMPGKLSVDIAVH